MSLAVLSLMATTETSPQPYLGTNDHVLIFIQVYQSFLSHSYTQTFSCQLCKELLSDRQGFLTFQSQNYKHPEATWHTNNCVLRAYGLDMKLTVEDLNPSVFWESGALRRDWVMRAQVQSMG